MDDSVADSVVAISSEQVGKFPGALFRSNQIAAFENAGNHVTFSTKVRDCVVRAFYAIGSSASMQQVIIWNLSINSKVGLDEVADKPTEFMEGMRTIFGEAGADVFEYMLLKEIKREFGVSAFPTENGRSLAGALQILGSNLAQI